MRKGIQLGGVCASNLLMTQRGIEEQGYTENADPSGNENILEIMQYGVFVLHVCPLHVLQISPSPTIETKAT